MSQLKDRLVAWIRDWFDQNGKDCCAVIGISGGKDSTVAAALCAEALGRDRVIGVLMPNVCQPDIDDSYRVVHHLGIRSYEIPITLPVTGVFHQLEEAGIQLTEQSVINLPPRIRMAVLYAVSQSLGGRVVNTTNLSEAWVGYGTRFGDTATGDLCPLLNLTCTEVVQLGHELALPPQLVDKVPSDGLCGLSDEDSFGFSYAVLDRYIRTGSCSDDVIRERIDALHDKNLFKQQKPSAFFPSPFILKGEKQP